MTRTSLPSRLVRVLVAASLAFGALGLAPALAQDRIGGVAIEDRADLAKAVPGVAMPAGILRTAEGRTLWERDATEVRAMASTTKIMTALVVLEHAKLDETVVVSPAAAAVGEAGIDLVAGEQMTVRQLLEAMLICSANDAAYALAEHVGGTVDAFVGMMNDKAKEMGLKNTAFANPHGLDAPGHHTTAADLAAMAAKAMADPTFASIVSKPSVTVTRAGVSKTYESSNMLIGTYDGAIGVKTGWTNEAGFCVVASARRGGITLVAVVLGASSEDDRFAQARALLDWGFTHYKPTQVASAEATAALVPVTDYLDRSVPAVVAADASLPVFDLQGDVRARVDVLPDVAAPIAKGQRLGTYSVVQGSTLLAQVPIIAAADVPAPEGWDRVSIFFTRLWRSIVGGQRLAPAVDVM